MDSFNNCVKLVNTGHLRIGSKEEKFRKYPVNIFLEVESTVQSTYILVYIDQGHKGTVLTYVHNSAYFKF